LHKKLSIKSLAFNMLAASIGFMLCANSVAANITNVEKNPANVETSNEVNDEAKSKITTDTLSETALVNLESIELEAESAVKPVSNTTSAQANASPTPTVIAAKNPYSQLVNLAFKGKGQNGVRSYADAAEQFCRDARDHNDANAQFALGWMYENGKGVAKNENVAVIFYSMAAKQLHQSARESLSASSGNPNIAKLPECMSKPSNMLGSTDSKTVGDTSLAQVESTPFYVKGSVYKLVSKIAPRFNIDTDLAMAFIAVESGFNPNATSNKNAQGLMQLIPATAARFNVKNAYDPEQNIKGGLAYLQWLLTYFEGDVQLVAAAYNSGENTVEKYKGVPPYPETRKYVKKIASLYKKSYHPFREDLGISKKTTINKVSG
jgi:soluble lytic murein transglycosylase-like protein